MFIIKENLFTKGIESLEYTARETKEGCFFGFIDGIEEVTMENLRNDYQEHLEDLCDDDIPESFEEYFGHSEKDLEGKRIFNIYDGGINSFIHAYSNDPDWDELLKFRYGAVNTPNGTKASFFIDEI